MAFFLPEEMLRELGLLCVLLLPAILLYLSRQDTLEQTVEKRTKTKSKKKKRKSKAQPAAESKTITTTNATADHTPITSSDSTKAASNVAAKEEKKSTIENSTASAIANNKKEAAEVDEHMDFTPRYSRVMRITTEREEMVPEVQPEDGWEFVPASSTKAPRSPKPAEDEPLTKKQRENLARAAKRKEQKVAADALQAERLRKHRRELEKIRIDEFYSKGAGKHTPWGSKSSSSSKRPTSTAGVNEHGQLIWD